MLHILRLQIGRQRHPLDSKFQPGRKEKLPASESAAISRVIACQSKNQFVYVATRASE